MTSISVERGDGGYVLGLAYGVNEQACGEARNQVQVRSGCPMSLETQIPSPGSAVV